jgi:hypothetical protein
VLASFIASAHLVSSKHPASNLTPQKSLIMKKNPAFDRSMKISTLAAALFCLPLAFPMATQATATEIGALQDLKPMSKSQLAKYRGGFRVGNYEIAIGVDIKGWVDGILKTSLNFTVGNLSGALAQHTFETPNVDVSGLNLPDTDDGTPDGNAAGATQVVQALNIQANTPDELAKLLVQHGVLNNIITNTQDGAKIEQVTKMTLAITNFQALNPAGLGSLGNLQSQLKGLGAFTGLR